MLGFSIRVRKDCGRANAMLGRCTRDASMFRASISIVHAELLQLWEAVQKRKRKTKKVKENGRTNNAISPRLAIKIEVIWLLVASEEVLLALAHAWELLKSLRLGKVFLRKFLGIISK